MKKHLDAFRKYLKAENFDAAIVAILDSDSAHHSGVRYLTGFSGSTAVVVVTPGKAYFITDSRYSEQVKSEVTGATFVQTKDYFKSVAELKEMQAKNVRVMVEAARLTVTQRKKFQDAMPQALLIDTTDVLENMGLIKDASEINAIKKACAISDEAFERILGILKPGIAEKEVAAELEYQMKMLGASKEAFSTIVASGWRSALPHGVASEKKLEKGDLITFDFGAFYDGYCSDITRTVVLGKATAKQKKIYNIVLRAQRAGIRKVKKGVTGKEVDAASRNIIKRAGYGDYFGHGTGHGIGLEVHAGPRVSPLGEQTLDSNMVITIEPGIYLPGWGGVRIEDDVVVRPQGAVVLNKATKKLLEL